VVLVGALLVGAHLFEAGSRGPVPVELHFGLGDPPVASAIEVVFTPEAGGEPVARFHTTLVAPDVKHITRLPAGRHVMDITMLTPGGSRHRARRTIEAARDAVIRLELAHEVR
jgi:hypothetical protein